MTYTPSFDGGTAQRVSLGAAHKAHQDANRARVQAAVDAANANYAAFMYGYRPQPPKKVEPKLTFKPETPVEQRIHDAASKRGWGNRPCAAGEVHFIRDGARDVVVTRDALKRVPILADTVVRQLENS